MTTYTLASPIPDGVNNGLVIQQITSNGLRGMWDDGTDIHLFANWGEGPSYAHYINLGTGDNAMITCPDNVYTVYAFAYHAASGKIIMGGGYSTGGTAEFDPADANFTTHTGTAVALLANSGAVVDMAVGTTDGLVYIAGSGGKLFQYNPSTGYPGGWTAYTPATTNSTTAYVGADDTHVYHAYRKTGDALYTMRSSSLSSESWSEWGGSPPSGYATDTEVKIGRRTGTGEWILKRVTSGGTTIVYTLDNGVATESAYSWDDSVPLKRQMIQAASADDVDSMGHSMGYDLDMINSLPVKDVREESTIGYKLQADSNYTYKTVSFSGDFWTNADFAMAVPLTSNTLFTVCGASGVAANVDYITKAVTYKGATYFSSYRVTKVGSGEIYDAGYSWMVTRYNPASAYTMTGSTTYTPPAPCNPYNITLTAGNQYHYLAHTTYDANGLVWFGGNSKYGNNGGNVWWYDPSDGSIDSIFDSWWGTPGRYFRNICAANSRSLLCVSDNLGDIWIVTASDQSVDGTPIHPIVGNTDNKAYMVETSTNDVLTLINVSDATTNGYWKIFRFNPSTKATISAVDDLKDTEGVTLTAQPFGIDDGSTSRLWWNPVLGPDGYVWLFMDDDIYRINPTTMRFEFITASLASQMTFGANNLDLILYGGGFFGYYPGILESSEPPADPGYRLIPRGGMHCGITVV